MNANEHTDPTSDRRANDAAAQSDLDDAVAASFPASDPPSMTDPTHGVGLPSQDTGADSAASSDLFQPVRLGPLTLPNRIVMAPLTRSRAGTGDVPGALNADLLRPARQRRADHQRGDPDLQQGKGYAFTPGIYTRGAGRRLAPRHRRGAREAAAASSASSGMSAASATPTCSRAASCRSRPRPSARRARPSPKPGFKPHVTPRALDTDEIPGIVERLRATPPNAPSAPGSTASRSTRPTATCSTSSSATAPTSAPTATAAASRTARASCWRSSRR